MRKPTFFLCAILHFQAFSVEAAERKITGKITAVDADRHSITVEDAVENTIDSRWGGRRSPVTVDVIRKTKITVEGEWARFDNILVGQSANITYDDKLEFATDIAVRESLVKDQAKTAADRKALQGNWICIAEEEATAGVIAPQTVKERDRRVTISQNGLTMKRTLDGKRGTFIGEFNIDAVTGDFNFIGTHANGDPMEWIGVYEIKNDTWRVRYSQKTTNESVRPAELDEREKTKSRMYTFKREVQ